MEEEEEEEEGEGEAEQEVEGATASRLASVSSDSPRDDCSASRDDCPVQEVAPIWDEAPSGGNQEAQQDNEVNFWGYIWGIMSFGYTWGIHVLGSECIQVRVSEL